MRRATTTRLYTCQNGSSVAVRSTLDPKSSEDSNAPMAPLIQRSHRSPTAFVGPREQPSPRSCAGCQAAARKRIRAWSATVATRSGPSTAGRVRSMLGRRRAGTTGTPSTTTLPQGTRAPWTATILLGVDDEHPTGADHQVVEVGPAAGDGQVVQDRPAVPLQGAEQSGGASLPRRSASPGDGVGAGPEPQPPASRHSGQPAQDQPQLGCQQAAEESAGGTYAEDAGHPPGQRPGPAGPLNCPLPAPPRLGGAAWPAHAGPHPDRYHWPIGIGTGQQLVGVVAQVSEDGLEVSRPERPHRPAGPVIVVEGPWSRAGH